MASDERINQTEWNVKKVCPICEDIKNKVLNLEGEQMMGDDGNPLFFFLFLLFFVKIARRG